MEQFNGPWKIGDFDSIKDCNNKEVRVYGLTLSDSDQAKINAKLIAAAPEMLAYLKNLSYDFEDERLEDLIKRATE